MYVYIQSEPGLYTVGFYDPSGEWHPHADFGSKEDSEKCVHYLNGGNMTDKVVMSKPLNK